MRPSFRFVLLVTILMATSLACNAVTHLWVLETPAPSVAPSTPPVDSSPDATAEPFACPQVTDKILEAATQFTEEEPGDENSEDPKELFLVTYSVTGDQISAPFYEEVPADLAGFQENITVHKEIWNDFVTLIPTVDRGALAEYSIVTDGEGNLLAAVAQTAFDPARWSLEVDIRDVSDKLNLTYTLIHEFAHLLTLGPDQVNPSEAVFNNPEDDGIFLQEVSACSDYFPGEGCSRSDSYINAFYNDFWADIYAEWQDINLMEDDDAYYEALDNFYDKYEERFLTTYSVSNPEEDIAEAFTFFVLSPRPKGDTIAEQKILFFYRNPKLTELRAEILRGVCQLNQ